jgi:WD40 repeat protein
VYVGTTHGSLRLWRLADGQATAAEATAHAGAVTAVAFSGEFTVATGGDDGAVRVNPTQVYVNPTQVYVNPTQVFVPRCVLTLPRCMLTLPRCM